MEKKKIPYTVELTEPLNKQLQLSQIVLNVHSKEPYKGFYSSYDDGDANNNPKKKKLYVYMYLPIHAINIQISSDEIQYTYISVKPRNLCIIAFKPYNLESQILRL